MLVLSDAAVDEVLSLDDLLPVVAEAFRKQGRGEVERPDRPHFPVGAGRDGPDPPGTGLAMPAYVHGADHFATKLVAVHEDNPPERPTVHAQVILGDARTGEPAALLAGERLTNARTGCIGGLAARHLVSGPVTLGLLGAGTQARWQARTIVAATTVERVRVFSPSDSREACAADLRSEGLDATAVDTPRAAVDGASVVVTTTTSRDPTFPADALADAVLVVAIGAYTPEMQELEPAVLDRAARVLADVPEEAVETGDLLAAGVTDPTPFSSALDGSVEAAWGDGSTDPSSDDGPTVVKSVGSAVLDAAASEHVYDRARAAGLGTEVDL